VWLITLITAALFYFSFFVQLSFVANSALFILPLIFYFLTFFDLVRAVNSKHYSHSPPIRKMLVFFAIALTYQFLSPATPAYFLLRNSPTWFVVKNNQLSPVYKQGDYLSTSRLAYSANLFFMDNKVIVTVPNPGDFVSFTDNPGERTTGIVIAGPDEQVVIQNGQLIVDDIPYTHFLPEGFTLPEEWPLTFVERSSILIGTFNLGKLSDLHQVPLEQVEGKVERLF